MASTSSSAEFYDKFKVLKTSQSQPFLPTVLSLIYPTIYRTGPQTPVAWVERELKPEPEPEPDWTDVNRYIEVLDLTNASKELSTLKMELREVMGSLPAYDQRSYDLVCPFSIMPIIPSEFFHCMNSRGSEESGR